MTDKLLKNIHLVAGILDFKHLKNNLKNLERKTFLNIQLAEKLHSFHKYC